MEDKCLFQIDSSHLRKASPSATTTKRGPEEAEKVYVVCYFLRSKSF